MRLLLCMRCGRQTASSDGTCGQCGSRHTVRVATGQTVFGESARRVKK